MAKFDKFSVMERIGATRMVPGFYSKDIDTAENVAKACCDGGVRAFEFTNRGDFAHEIFAELMIYVREHCPGMALGAGTTCNTEPISLSPHALTPKLPGFATAAESPTIPAAPPSPKFPPPRKRDAIS